MGERRLILMQFIICIFEDGKTKTKEQRTGPEIGFRI